MMLLTTLTSAGTWALIILAISIVPIIILIIYAVIKLVKNKRGEALLRRDEITDGEDENQKEYFFTLYGGKENINAVSLSFNRLSVRVKDIDKVKVDELKGAGAKGVLLVDDNVKCNYGDRAPYIFRMLNKFGE